MTGMVKAAGTPARVAGFATQTGALTSNGGSSLIGLIGSGTEFTALVLTASGQVRKVGVGRRLDGGKIVAIDELGLVLQKNGRSWRLALPAG